MKNTLSTFAAVLVAGFAANGAAEAHFADIKTCFPCKVAYPADGKPQVLRIDLGAPSTGGYAVFDVAEAKGRPVMRVAYANHPDGLGEKGCFSRETSARYLGPTFDIPALPGNINRHEIYEIRRTGRFVAPLIQGQERDVRIQLDSGRSAHGHARSPRSRTTTRGNALAGVFCRASLRRRRGKAGAARPRHAMERCLWSMNSTQIRISRRGTSMSSPVTGALWSFRLRQTR